LNDSDRLRNDRSISPSIRTAFLVTCLSGTTVSQSAIMPVVPLLVTKYTNTHIDTQVGFGLALTINSRLFPKHQDYMFSQ